MKVLNLFKYFCIILIILLYISGCSKAALEYSSNIKEQNVELDKRSVKQHSGIKNSVTEKSTIIKHQTLDLLKIGNISIVERGELRDFPLQGPYYFSDTNGDIVLDIPIGNKQINFKVEDLFSELNMYFVNEVGNKQLVETKIEYNNNDFIPQIRLIYENAPKEDLILQLVANEQKPLASSHTFTFNYLDPLTYIITNDDPLLKRSKQVTHYMQLNHDFENIFPYYVPIQKPIELIITFNQDVKPLTMEEALKESLQDIYWRVNWIDGRTTRLTLLLESQDMYRIHKLDLSGVESKNEFVLVWDKGLNFIASNNKTISKIQEGGKKTPLFSTVLHYDEFQVSPNGKWALVSEESYGGERHVSTYSIIDLQNKGKTMKQFEPGQILFPQWLPGGQSFVYQDDEQVFLYDVQTGREQLIWVSPQKGKAKDRIHWVRHYVEEKSGMMAIFDYLSTNVNYTFPYEADFYLFTDVNDSTPDQVTKFQTGSCQLEICYRDFIFINPTTMLIESDNPTEQQKEGFPRYFVMDTQTLEKRELEHFEGRINTHLGDGEFLVVEEININREYRYSVLDINNKNMMKFLFESRVNVLRPFTGEMNNAFRTKSSKVYVFTDHSWSLIDLNKLDIQRVEETPLDQINDTLYISD
ncbi:hypothetical protein ACFSCX_13320 [Bacillus salitolerans]|uniref:Lipoprotein n=1 Tax=Bacillus salitolerans TaxID=1437434 RepID=A0ABW4LQV0_9BACI